MSDEVKSMSSASADTALDSSGAGASAGDGDVDGRRTSSVDNASTINDGNGIVLRRKKPIAAWRLAIMFAW